MASLPGACQLCICLVAPESFPRKWNAGRVCHRNASWMVPLALYSKVTERKRKTAVGGKIVPTGDETFLTAARRRHRNMPKT